MKKTGLLLGSICLALSLSATPTVASGVLDKSNAKRVNAPFLYAVAWQRTSAEMAAISYQTYNTAERVIAEKIRLGNYKKADDGRLVEEIKTVTEDGRIVVKTRPLAIVLDLDETVFDNSAYEVWSTMQPGAYDDGNWGYFCKFQGETPAAQREMPGSVNFLKKCMEWGVTPIYITNRDLPQREDTLKTLRGMGLDSPRLEEQLIVRDKAKNRAESKELAKRTGLADGESLPQELINNASDKAGRRLAVELDYKVLAYFGDNLYDHPVYVDPSHKGYEALKDREEQVRKNARHFGVDWFVLPNVTYGSWVKTSIFPERSKSVVEMLDDSGFGAWMEKNGPKAKK